MTGRPGLLIITNINEDKEYNKIYPKMEKRFTKYLERRSI